MDGLNCGCSARGGRKAQVQLRGRSFRQRCTYGLAFIFREWCRNTWLSASQGARWANDEIGYSSSNPLASPKTTPTPLDTRRPLLHSPQVPTVSHCPHQDGEAEPRYAPGVAVNGVTDVLKATLERGTVEACEAIMEGW